MPRKIIIVKKIIAQKFENGIRLKAVGYATKVNSFNLLEKYIKIEENHLDLLKGFE